MLVSIKCSGGFAGVERSLGSIDSRTLPQPAAARLTQCIDELIATSRRQGAEPLGADLLRYEFTITTAPGGSASHFMISDDGDSTRPPMSLVAEILAFAVA